MLMAAFAVVLIKIQERDVLLVLWLAMVLGWCIREQATANAKRIRSESNYVNAVAILVVAENRSIAQRLRFLASVKIANVQRYACEVCQATLTRLGLTHHGLAPRLLPIPGLTARQ
jgi:hypothetical protein